MTMIYWDRTPWDLWHCGRGRGPTPPGMMSRRLRSWPHVVPLVYQPLNVILSLAMVQADPCDIAI